MTTGFNFNVFNSDFLLPFPRCLFSASSCYCIEQPSVFRRVLQRHIPPRESSARQSAGAPQALKRGSLVGAHHLHAASMVTRHHLPAPGFRRSVSTAASNLNFCVSPLASSSMKSGSQSNSCEFIYFSVFDSLLFHLDKSLDRMKLVDRQPDGLRLLIGRPVLGHFGRVSLACPEAWAYNQW